MTQELSPSATEKTFEDKLVPEKYLARLRVWANAIGDAQLASELEAAASKLNAFSATDIHCARAIIHFNTPSEYNDGAPRDLRNQKIRSGLLKNGQELDSLEDILKEAETLVASVRPAENNFSNVQQKLRNALSANGLDDNGQPLSNTPKPAVRGTREFYATPLKSAPKVSSENNAASPSAVAHLFPEPTTNILKRKHTGQPSTADAEASAPEGFAARMEALCLKPRITHAARWQELQSIAKEMKEHPLSPENKSTNPADTQAWQAFQRLMNLNAGSKPEQQQHRVQLFAHAFRADAKRHVEFKNATPLNDYFSALSDIYHQNISVQDGWKKVEALYQNIQQQHFHPSSADGHLKISDINAKLQPVLVDMFEHNSLTPQEGLQTLSNVLEELYDDVRAIDAREGFHARLAEKSPATGELGSTPLTAKWLEMLPSTVVAKPHKGGYYGKYQTAAEFDKAQKSRQNWDKKFAGGVGILGLLGVPAAYFMRPQVPTHNPNETHVPEMTATPPRPTSELWQDKPPTPIPPSTPPAETPHDDLPIAPYEGHSDIDHSTEEVDTPHGPMPRDLWEMTQDADRRFGRRHVSPDEPTASTETPHASSAFDEAFNKGATTTDAPTVDPELPPATTEPDNTPPADTTARKISVRGHADGYRARFSLKGESFAEKALAPDSTTVTFRS